MHAADQNQPEFYIQSDDAPRTCSRCCNAFVVLSFNGTMMIRQLHRPPTRTRGRQSIIHGATTKRRRYGARGRWQAVHLERYYGTHRSHSSTTNCVAVWGPRSHVRQTANQEVPQQQDIAPRNDMRPPPGAGSSTAKYR